MATPQNADRSYQNAATQESMVVKGRMTARDCTVQNLTVQNETVLNRLSADVLASNAFYAGAGTVDAPAFSFGDDPTTGVYLPSTSVLGLSAGGVLCASADSQGVHSTSFLAEDGTAAAPSHTFESDATAGWYLAGADTVGLAVAGVNRVLANTYTFQVNSALLAISNGTASSPSFGFATDTDTGLYYAATNTIGFATAGASAATLNGSGILAVVGGVSAPAGTAAAPSVLFTSDTDTGLYRAAANTVGIAAGGAVAATVSDTAVTLSKPLTLNSTGGFASASLAVQSTSASVITPTANVTVAAANATTLGNLCILMLAGSATGAAATIGTLAVGFRPAATATGGSVFVTTTAPASTARTISISTTGVITQSSALAVGDEWQLQATFLTS